jgi:sporulation protein YhbH
MSIFREHKTNSDRSAGDRSRHKNKIKKALQEGIHNIVEEESIITDANKGGKTKYRIPVKGIKEYRFIYGDNQNNKNVGSAPGKDIKRGQKIGDGQQQGKAQGNKASDEAGEEVYDVEIDNIELAKLLFDELELPELQKRQLSNIQSEKLKRSGYRSDGIIPRLDKKKSAIARIKRMKAAGFNPDNEEGETFPFHEEDLKYRHYKMKEEPNTNAVIFFLMDVSGSMSQDKKFLARSFYFLLFQFLKTKYETIDIVFIAHDTQAKEVEEKEFFTRGSSGGTIASSALTLTQEIIDKRYHPSSWNIYVFQCSDGDNFSHDNELFFKKASELAEVTQLYGYCEITGNDYYSSDYSTLLSVLMPLQSPSMRCVKINDKSDVWKAFSSMMGGAVG